MRISHIASPNKMSLKTSFFFLIFSIQQNEQKTEQVMKEAREYLGKCNQATLKHFKITYRFENNKKKKEEKKYK